MWTAWKHTGCQCRGSVSAEQLLCVDVAPKRVSGYPWNGKSFFDIWPVVQRPERAVVAAASSSCRRNHSSWGNSQLYQQGVLLHWPAPWPCCASQPASVCIVVAQHSVPKAIKKSCRGEATGTIRSLILSQRVDAALRVHLVQRLY